MWELQKGTYLQITHTDLDGIGAFILSHAYGLTVEPYLVDYSTLYEPVQEGVEEQTRLHHEVFSVIKDMVLRHDGIIITDVSLSKEAYEEILALGKPVYFFDHHEVSLGLAGRENCFVDKAASGTLLYYRWLASRSEHSLPAMEEFSKLVDCYDRYDSQSPDWDTALDLNRMFWGSAQMFKPSMDPGRFQTFINIQLNKVDAPAFEFTMYEKVAIAKQVEKEQKEYGLAKANMQIRTDDRGVKYILWHGASKISYLCFLMLKEYPDIGYVVNVNTFNESDWKRRMVNGKLSVRSRQGSGLSVTRFQGIHGHENAGGGKFEVEEIKKMWFTPTHHLQYIDETNPATAV